MRVDRTCASDGSGSYIRWARKRGSFVKRGIESVVAYITDFVRSIAIIWRIVAKDIIAFSIYRSCKIEIVIFIIHRPFRHSVRRIRIFAMFYCIRRLASIPPFRHYRRLEPPNLTRVI